MTEHTGHDEHAADVLAQLQCWQGDGRHCALVVIAGTYGGAMRAPGALMAVCEDGRTVGYVSGGCIDADVVQNANAALRTGLVQKLRYGAGSPFVDLPLPCGGAIELLILPKPDSAIVAAAATALSRRRPVRLAFHQSGQVRQADPRAATGWNGDRFVAHYVPKLRLRIAGRGADCLALARLAHVSGFDVHLQLSRDPDIEAALSLGISHTALSTPRDLPALADDAWTAFVGLFHDRDWEPPLIAQAIAGPAFYVGAVGSARAHARRCADLQRLGARPHQLARVRGPIGLIPSMRDASTLAISALAEIVGEHQRQLLTPTRSTGLLLLAAGASSRFEGGDKLLASLHGQPVLAHAAQRFLDRDVGARIAVVAPQQQERRVLLERHGWTVVENPNALDGQAASLQAGLSPIAADHQIERVLIMLGDMPFVADAHLDAMLQHAPVDALMSETPAARMPPALFARSCFEALLALRGDRGAREVFDGAARTATLPLSPDSARDIDTHDDLNAIWMSPRR
jgi:xanthine dehydrogenase accessory factor